MATHKAAGGSISRKTNPTTLNRPKRRTPEASGDRDSSPDKRHVSFDRRLERGPTPSSPHRRPNQSPSRSALSNRAAKQSALAEQQLLAEMQSPTGGSPSNHHWQDSHGLHHGDCPEFPGQLEGALPRWQPETAGYIQPGSSDSYNSWTLLQIKDEEARDREVCRRVHDLRALIVEFAREYACETSRRYTRPQNIARDLCRNARNAQLIRYIGCLAYGGPNGVQDWDNILAGSETMAALVTGIISTALREHVFAALWFGGTTDEIEELEKLEDKQKDDDGYRRTETRARRCINFNEKAAYHLQVYEAAKLRVKIALLKMLKPLFFLKQGSQLDLPEALRSDLSKIVDVAGDLSREMRQCEHVIYFWPPTFKDEEFDQDRMECLNIESMIKSSPYSRHVTNGQETTVLVGPPEEAEAIVKIVAFPGLVVHRKGGGALALSLLREERSGPPDPSIPPDVYQARMQAKDGCYKLNGEEGYRTRVLCKSVVHLTWGKQRLLTREAGTSAHLDAMRDGNLQKYDIDREGLVELYDYFVKNNAQAPALF